MATFCDAVCLGWMCAVMRSAPRSVIHWHIAAAAASVAKSGPVGDSVAVWDNIEGALFVYDGDRQTWAETKVAKKYVERISPALCAFETGFALWGGWSKPHEVSRVVVARDSGVVIEVEPNDG